jgi:hypothetical protein
LNACTAAPLTRLHLYGAAAYACALVRRPGAACACTPVGPSTVPPISSPSLVSTDTDPPPPLALYTALEADLSHHCQFTESLSLAAVAQSTRLPGRCRLSAWHCESVLGPARPSSESAGSGPSLANKEKALRAEEGVRGEMLPREGSKRRGHERSRPQWRKEESEGTEANRTPEGQNLLRYADCRPARGRLNSSPKTLGIGLARKSRRRRAYRWTQRRAPRRGGSEAPGGTRGP